MACSGFNALKLIILFFDFLGQLPEFCSRDSSLVVKEIFGVTEYASILNFGLFGSHKETKDLKSATNCHFDTFNSAVFFLRYLKIIVSGAHSFFVFSSLSDDADKLRIHTLSEA